MIAFFPSRAIALSIGSFSIHWYGLLYLTAFLLAYVLLPHLQKYRNLTLTRDDWAALLSWAIGGVIIGGRLGYVLFYEPAYFLQHPQQIIAVWNGGMASHGGFIGVVCAVLWICHRRRLPLFSIADTVVVPAALGLACGRIGNYINLELYGTVTTLPWGMTIPGVEGLRHPTQIYAVLKDMLIAVLCLIHLHRVREQPHGRTFALFLMLYAILRFTVEYFREQPYGYLFGLSFGQLYTLPVFIAGAALYAWLRKRHR